MAGRKRASQLGAGARSLTAPGPVRRCSLAAVLAIQLGGETLAAEDLPDLVLLQFLGEFETDEGEWIAPDLLLEGEFSQLLDALEAQQQTTDGAQPPDQTSRQDNAGSRQAQQSGEPDSNE